jgi:hypothetical protein
MVNGAVAGVNIFRIEHWRAYTSIIIIQCKVMIVESFCLVNKEQ